jgi:hypothetical protein
MLQARANSPENRIDAERHLDEQSTGVRALIVPRRRGRRSAFSDHS